MYKNKRRRLLHSVLLVLFSISFSCGTSSEISGLGNDSAIDPEPFIRQARNDQCSNTRNNLYIIDNKSVLWDRAGNCADNSYSQTLYGQNIGLVLCVHFDSIAGPRTVYHDEKYKELFDTVVANLDKSDLGLGTGHSVVPVSTGNACTTSAGCSSTEYCAKATGDCEGRGSCVVKPNTCPLAPVSIDDLVCGCDGHPYGNYVGACDAAELGVNIAHKGACP